MSLTENVPPICNETSNHGIASSQQTLRQTPVKQEDDCTECETPFSSPDYESTVVTRRMTQSSKEEMESRIECKGEEEEHPMPSLVKNAIKVFEEDHHEGECGAWPMSNIAEPGKNDVLFGRGGG